MSVSNRFSAVKLSTTPFLHSITHFLYSMRNMKLIEINIIQGFSIQMYMHLLLEQSSIIWNFVKKSFSSKKADHFCHPLLPFQQDIWHVIESKWKGRTSLGHLVHSEIYRLHVICLFSQLSSTFIPFSIIASLTGRCALAVPFLYVRSLEDITCQIWCQTFYETIPSCSNNQTDNHSL